MLNAFNSTYGGNRDGFVASFTSEGQLRWTTYLGGSGDDRAVSSAVGSYLYVVGDTDSTNFPTLNAYQDTNKGLGDLIVTAFDFDGNPVWSTYMGGMLDETGYGVATDTEGNVVVTGWTNSEDFPVVNAFQQNLNASFDGIVASFSSTGILRWSTYLGGSGVDSATGVFSDSMNNFHVIGNSRSTDFPLLNPYQNNLMGMRDVTISTFTQDGVLVWSTYFGSSSDFDIAYSGAAGPSDNIFIPVILSGDLPVRNGNNKTTSADGYVAQIYNPESDYDGDQLKNIDELKLGTDLESADTDADGMPDGFEYENGLNVTLNDAEDDLDGDGMPNLREYQNGLDPTVNDADGDIDEDGISNLDEYLESIGQATTTAQPTSTPVSTTQKTTQMTSETTSSNGATFPLTLSAVTIVLVQKRKK